MDETEYWHDIELHQRLALIGKTVMIGIYTKETEEHVGTMCGTLTVFAETDGDIEFKLSDAENPLSFSPKNLTALVSWLADDR